ncbi:MAG: class D sortase [Clostridiaceae bacterium]|nr:class D sortase [Clostridiaceae bacterium]
MKKIRFLAIFACLVMTLAPPAGALEYTIDTPEGTNYGKPTSIEVPQTADGGARKNEDISKNAAKIPPLFGSEASNTLNTGSYLTPNLIPGMQPSGGMISGSNAAVVLPPSVGGVIGSTGSSGSTGSGMISNGTTSPGNNSTTTGSNFTTNTQPNTSSGFTKVTSDMYYSNGHLGTLKIPAIDLSVKVYEGTDGDTLHKGVGHFTDSSIWSGNVALAGHNRGKVHPFNKLHKLAVGDEVTLKTKLGTRAYKVVSVSKVGEDDRSGLAVTRENRLTLYTCVEDERDYRWCVVCTEIV